MSTFTKEFPSVSVDLEIRKARELLTKFLTVSDSEEALSKLRQAMRCLARVWYITNEGGPIAFEGKDTPLYLTALPYSGDAESHVG